MAKKCSWCGKKDLSDNARSCNVCKTRTFSFERLCVFCKKQMPLTANQCNNCDRQQLMVQMEWSHVRCGGCGIVWEMDNLFAGLRIPLIFQTAKGVKLGWFRSPEAAAAECEKYFHKGGTTADLIRDKIVQDDAEPWRFPTVKHAVAFLNNFPCNECGKKNWERAVAADIKEGTKKAAIAAKPYLIPATISVWGFLLGVFAVIRSMFRGITRLLEDKPVAKQEQNGGDQRGGGNEQNRPRRKKQRGGNR